VPVGLERLQLWRTTQLPAWAIARLHDGDSGPGRYRGDVQLLDEDGQVLCSIEGLILQAVDRHALLGQSPDSAAEPNSTVPAAAAGPAPPPAELEAPVRRQLADLPTESARRQALDELLQDELRRVLHLPASAVIPADRGFFDMGLDSLMATEIRNRLQHQLGVLLPPTVMFKFTTAAELSEHLHELLARTPQLAVAVPPAATPSPAVATAPAQGPAAEDAYARVAQLSEDELAALIDAKLKRFSE
jgi:acyl carrier protein